MTITLYFYFLLFLGTLLVLSLFNAEKIFSKFVISTTRSSTIFCVKTFFRLLWIVLPWIIIELQEVRKLECLVCAEWVTSSQRQRQSVLREPPAVRLLTADATFVRERQRQHAAERGRKAIDRETCSNKIQRGRHNQIDAMPHRQF